MKPLILGLIFLTMGVSCKEKIQYSVLQDDKLNKILFVQTDTVLTNDEILYVAQEVEKTDTTRDKYLVLYLSPDQKVNENSYACSFVESDTSSNLYSQHIVLFNLLNNNKIKSDENINGYAMFAWEYENSHYGDQMQMYWKDNSLFLRTIYLDGSIGDSRCKVYTKFNELCFMNEFTDSFWRFDKQGGFSQYGVNYSFNTKLLTNKRIDQYYK